MKIIISMLAGAAIGWIANDMWPRIWPSEFYTRVVISDAPDRSGWEALYLQGNGRTLWIKLTPEISDYIADHVARGS